MTSTPSNDGDSTPLSSVPSETPPPSSSSTNNDIDSGSGNEQLSLEELTSLIYRNNGRPCRSRDEAVEAMRVLMGQHKDSSSNAQQRPSLANVHGNGPLLLSDIPESSRRPGVVVGIDEAGRGSVLGPMIYGAAFWNLSEEQGPNKTIPKGFNDSKQLTDETRSQLLKDLLATSQMGFCTRILHASEISRNMLRANPYNLNQMSHDAAMAMIRAILAAGVPIQTCYIDTVGNPESYKRKLEREFSGIDFVVESKADAKYASCSAASVVAKVLRDRMMEDWLFSEPNNHTSTISREFGSGYPSDPKCKKWLEEELADPLFGWPDVVRFSWGPAKHLLEQNAVAVEFQADHDNNHEDSGMDAAALASRKRQQEQMKSFLGSDNNKKSTKAGNEKRFPYFERQKLQVVDNVF